MKIRLWTSLVLAVTFFVLSVSGLILFFLPYHRTVDAVHSIFGLLFVLAVLPHVYNNCKSLLSYFKRPKALFVIVAGALVLLMAYRDLEPFRSLMDWRSSVKARTSRQVEGHNYQLYDFSEGEAAFITIDFVKGEHFWNPQMAFWIEDTLGNYITTLMVTNSTARGLFYSGRSPDNFREYDGVKQVEQRDIRRVNALPHWSHQRGVKAIDGSYAPHRGAPLVDGITGATPTGSFLFKSAGYEALNQLSVFVVKMEINVAFDQNEFFSEYDYLEDSEYHGGTGLLGQPSLIYSARVYRDDRSRYYLMELLGHGHHSGKNGTLYHDLTKITTAAKIAERVVVGVNF
ncbi:hypothetical protein C900_03902 [Fulvivirga imtechensis AK7]|uniref:Flavinylation-associated cytochrome domain-containing protein n=1 Tax=Fulvivirga imtechensis AK7 TaxID=1237149 RepID=L8JS78_9BACT|nr:DUF4405 domain-containing protein [Fulvivirga imtechensis]ELR70217.1 hypothetical protein C900_03902 [Fulvivirga imtechensis AK7]